MSKEEDPSSNPQSLHTKLGVVTCVCNSSAVGGQRREDSGAHRPLVISRLSETLDGTLEVNFRSLHTYTHMCP